MPRQYAPPRYRHYKPKDLAVVRIDGKDHYLGKFGSPESWERYHRLLAEQASSPGRPAGTAKDEPAGTPPTPALSITELLVAYWEHAQGYYRDPDGQPSRELDGIRLSLRPLRKLYGSLPAAEFGPVALKAVRQEMIDSGLARTTINYRIGKVVRVFRWAVECELVPPSSHHALRAVAGLRKGRSVAPEPSAVRPVGDAAVDAVRPFVTRQVWAMIELQRLTAARPGEILALRTGDVDRSAETWVYRPRRHKTAHHGIERRILLGPKAREVLTPWLRADPDAPLFQPCEAVEDRNQVRRESRRTPMTPSQRRRVKAKRRSRAPGECYEKNSYRNSIWRACDRAFPHPTLGTAKPSELSPDQAAELKAWRKAHRWHPNQLRHAAATAIRARYGLEAAQVVLGHSRADVTQVYAERDLTKATEVMREIG